jgi:Ca2+-binding RTX toxin-like protein
VLHSVKRRWVVPSGVLVLLASSAGAAVAQGVTGTPGPDRLRGTNQADTFQAFAGNDRVRAFAGDDVADLGPGNDRARGGRGDDTIQGGGGRDRLVGGRGNDTLRGGGGNDVIFNNVGQDTASGGPGNDRIWALARRDVQGAGDTTGDTVSGGDGDDRIFVRDGERDTVTCGAGQDHVRADFMDVVDTSCEVVRRAAPGPRDARPEGAS